MAALHLTERIDRQAEQERQQKLLEQAAYEAKCAEYDDECEQEDEYAGESKKVKTIMRQDDWTKGRTNKQFFKKHL